MAGMLLKMNTLQLNVHRLSILLIVSLLISCSPHPDQPTADSAITENCVDTLLQERIESDFNFGGSLRAAPEGYLFSYVEENTSRKNIRTGLVQHTVLLNKQFRKTWQKEHSCGCMPNLNDIRICENGYVALQNNCNMNFIRLDKSGKEISSVSIPELYGTSRIYAVDSGFACIGTFEKVWEMQANLIRFPRFGVLFIRTDSAGNELNRTELDNYSKLNGLPALPVITGKYIGGIADNEVRFYNMAGNAVHTRKLSNEADDKNSYGNIIPNGKGGIAYIHGHTAIKNKVKRNLIELCSTDSTGRELYRLELVENNTPLNLRDVKPMSDGSMLVAATADDALWLYKISAEGKITWKTDTQLDGATYMDMTENTEKHIILLCSRKIRRYAQKVIFQEYDAAGKKVCRE